MVSLLLVTPAGAAVGAGVAVGDVSPALVAAVAAGGDLLALGTVVAIIGGAVAPQANAAAMISKDSRCPDV